MPKFNNKHINIFRGEMRDDIGGPSETSQKLLTGYLVQSHFTCTRSHRPCTISLAMIT